MASVSIITVTQIKRQESLKICLELIKDQTYKHIIEINDTTLENIVDEIIKRLIVSKFVSYYELDREMIKEIFRNKI